MTLPVAWMVASDVVPLASRIAKAVRGRGDAVRHVYMTGRLLLHARSHLARRRAARTVQAPAGLALPPDTGYRLFPPDAFPEAREVVNDSQRLLSRSGELLQARRRARDSKQFLVNLLDAATLRPDHPLVRLAVRPDVLDAVVTYMGTIPVLRSLQVFYSGAVDREPISSQLYHCDADDVRQLKIFVLCSEVRSENGPLTLLDAARSARVRRATRYRYAERLTDDDVARVIGCRDGFEVVGDPGTTCFVDTSRCFHFGSRVEAGAPPRLVAMIQYLSPRAFVLTGGPRAGAALARLPAHDMTPIQRAVLTGDHRDL